MLSSVMSKVSKVLYYQKPYQDQNWENTLADMTELEALIEIRHKLSKINFSDQKHLINKIDLVLDIDEKTYKKINEVTHKYLIKLNNNKNVKGDAHIVVYAYQRQLYATYGLIVDACLNQEQLKLNLEKVNFILARYLNAAFTMAKWRYFDDQAAPLGVWDNIHKIIKTAEDLSVMNENFFLYDFQIKETSIAAILKSGFMLDTLQKGNYNRFEIELADIVLKTWSSNSLILHKFKENEFQFHIQLEKDKRPDRVRDEMLYTDCRYWKTTRLVDLIENYLCAADMHKPLDTFRQIKIASTADIVKLFKKLRVDWCVEGFKRQRRREARSNNVTLLNISYGIDGIYRRLINLKDKPSQNKMQNENVSLALAQEKNEIAEKLSLESLNTFGDNWRTLDVSESGFAIKFGKNPADWVEEGALVGYLAIDRKNTFSIAEIKNVRKQADGTYRAGFEKIASSAIAIEVTKVEKNAVLEPVDGYFLDDGENLVELSKFSGLFVEDEKTTIAKLIIPSKQYQRGSSYKIAIAEKEYIVMPCKVLSMQKEWVYLEVTV